MNSHKVNPTWSGWRDNSRCLDCGADLGRYARPDKLYCDDACSKRYRRRQAKRLKRLDQALEILTAFVTDLTDQDDPDFIKQAYAKSKTITEASKKLRQEIYIRGRNENGQN